MQIASKTAQRNDILKNFQKNGILFKNLFKFSNNLETKILSNFIIEYFLEKLGKFSHFPSLFKTKSH